MSAEAQDKLTAYLKADTGNTVFEALRDGLTSGPPLKRVLAIYCLKTSGKPEAMELIARYLDDPDHFVQRAAVAAVSQAKTATPEQTALMRQLISSEDPVIRKEAVQAAGRLKDTEAIPLLIELLDTANAGFRAEILWSLHEITGKDLGPDRAAWESWHDFYRKEVLAVQSGTAGGSGGREARPIPRAAGTAGTYSSYQGEAQQTASPKPWGAIIAGLAALAVIGAWLGCRLWLSTTMKRMLKLDPSARSASAIAARFAASDLMPGFIVYPFLMRCIANGSPSRVGVALHVLMFRIHGGCRQVASKGGRLPQQKPTQGGRDVVLKLPRGLLSDMALVGNPAGRCLIRVAEPDNPAWKREPNDREVQIARKHLAERPQSDN